MWSFNCQLSPRRERERKKEGRVRELVSLLHIYASVPNLRFLGRQAVWEAHSSGLAGPALLQPAPGTASAGRALPVRWWPLAGQTSPRWLVSILRQRAEWSLCFRWPTRPSEAVQ